jgi:integrase
MRRGEVCGLRWLDVDVDACELHIRRRAVLGPGDKLRIAACTKTSSGRTVVLAESTIELLERHRLVAQAEAARLGVVWDPECFVFWTPGEPRRPMRPDLLSARWRRACRRAGVKVRLHDLRHLHASILVRAGVDLATVGDRLGHSGGGRTTLAIYAHGSPDSERVAAEMFAALVRQQSDEGR